MTLADITTNPAEGISKIKQIKSGMNSSRITFTWEHLNMFYSR
jgi:hypothetical protein